MGKASMVMGVYAGIMNLAEEGKLLLRRRTEEHSIIPGKSFKGNWELPGGAVNEALSSSVPYNYYLTDLVKSVKERTGIALPESTLATMPMMQLVLFKGPAGYDLAAVTPVITAIRPTVADTIYVSPKELAQLAKEFVAADEKTGKDGVGLLSGEGKRMHCMALAALCHSPNPEYAKQAAEMLQEISKPWVYHRFI